MAPGANIGHDVAIFEAVHGSAPDIAGRKIANPCALMLAAGQMLSHLGMQDKANRLHKAITATIAEGDRTTPDLGGTGHTDDFAEAIIERL
jgi:isocitrate dehydrogenase (NAD+)